MNIKAKLQNSQEQNAPKRTWVENPFDQLYQVEDWIYDNATVQIKEIISDVQEEYYESDYLDEDLDSIVAQIKHNQLNYVRDAIKYYFILSKRLYKKKYSNFNEFAKRELGMTSWRCKQIIEAGIVCLKLITFGFTQLPLNSSQAYALSKLNDEELIEAWKSVLAMYDIWEITADKINLAINPPEPNTSLKDSQIRVMPSVYEQLVVNACNFRLTISDYIKHLLELQKCEFFLLFKMIGFKT